MNDTVLIRISRDLAMTFGTRTEDGRRLTFDLGDPTEFVERDDLVAAWGREAVYTPTITATDDGAHVCRCSDNCTPVVA